MPLLVFFVFPVVPFTITRDKTLLTWIGSCKSSHVYSRFSLFPVTSVWSASHLFLFSFVVFHSTERATSVSLIYSCSSLTVCTALDFWTPLGQCRHGLHLLSVLKLCGRHKVIVNHIRPALIHLLSVLFPRIVCAGYDSFTCYICPSKLSFREALKTNRSCRRWKPSHYWMHSLLISP